MKVSLAFRFLFVLCFFLWINCENNNKALFKEKQLKELIDKLPQSYEKVLVIPGSGCTGCISDAEKFVIRGMNNLQNQYLIIFTNINSLKLLKLRLGKKVHNQDNIIFDSKNLLHFRSIYPILIKVSHIDQFEIIELDPKKMVQQINEY